jgi:hypothetical protein
MSGELIPNGVPGSNEQIFLSLPCCYRVVKVFGASVSVAATIISQFTATVSLPAI